MTSTPLTGDMVIDFRRALSNAAAQSFTMSADEIIRTLSPMLARGWTVEQVAKWCCQGTGGVDNPGALVRYRLDQAKTMDPPKATDKGIVKFVQPLPYCGRCDDPLTRWLLDDTGEILGRCPHCWTVPS